MSNSKKEGSKNKRIEFIHIAASAIGVFLFFGGLGSVHFKPQMHNLEIKKTQTQLKVP